MLCSSMSRAETLKRAYLFHEYNHAAGYREILVEHRFGRENDEENLIRYEGYQPGVIPNLLKKGCGQKERKI